MVTMYTKWYYADIEGVRRHVLGGYYSNEHFMERRTSITNFSQDKYEPLSEAWERFKLLLCKCPNHNMNFMEQLTHLIGRLTISSQMFLDASSGGTLITKIDDETRIIIENVCHN